MASPITRFLRTVLSLLETGLARPYLKHLTELFRFLYDFSKLGEVEESRFLLSINTITIFVEFYLKAIRQTPEGGHIEVFFLIFFENKFFHFWKKHEKKIKINFLRLFPTMMKRVRTILWPWHLLENQIS